MAQVFFMKFYSFKFRENPYGGLEFLHMCSQQEIVQRVRTTVARVWTTHSLECFHSFIRFSFRFIFS
jgi:hypothetical protein